MKKLIIFIILCLIGYALLTNAIDKAPDIESYSFTGYSDYNDTTENSTDATTRTDGNQSTSTTTIQNHFDKIPRAAKYIPDQSVCYFYRQLDTFEKEIYNLLLANVADGDTTFSFDLKYDGKYYDNAIEHAVYALVQDHPEFFWLSRGYSYSYRGNRLNITLGTREFWRISISHEKYTEPFFDKVDFIVSQAQNYNTDYEKALFVHDYLVSTTFYDDYAAEANNNNWTLENDYAFSSYGGLVKGKWVCGGYSAGFQLIMQQLGIECAWVSGYAGGYHAWNLVKLDGEYYWLDATWNDVDDWKTSEGELTYQDGIRYNYFNLTTSDFYIDHTPEMFEFPTCISTKYNYHCYNDYYLDSFSEEKLQDIMDRQIAAGYTDISFKFSDITIMEKSFNCLGTIAANSLSKYGYNGDYTWYYDDTMKVITCCLLDPR